MPKRRNSVESLKSLKWWNPLRVRADLPEMIAKGADALTPAEKDLLKWVGVFFRKPTPGQFMMRIRMPNGFATSAQLRAIAEISHRIGNGVLDITTRQQIELRGFTLASVPEIWEKLHGVDLTSLADRHGQRAQHQRLRAGGLDAARIPGCLAGGLRFESHHRGRGGQPGIHQSPPKIQRHHHGVHGQLHP